MFTAKKSRRVTSSATILGLLMISSLISYSSQEPYPVFMGVNLRNKGKMVDQLEFLKSAVDRLQTIVEKKSSVLTGQHPITYSDIQNIDLNNQSPAQLEDEHSSHLHKLFMPKPQTILRTLECEACWIVGQVLQNLIDSTTVQSYVETGAIFLCSSQLEFFVCRGFVNSLSGVIIENLQSLIVQPDYLCTEFVNMCDQKYFNNLDPTVFVKNMLSDKPASLNGDDFVDNLYQQIAADPAKDQRSTLKVVQFTDIHLDLKYVSGTAKTCDYVICCREVNGKTNNKTDQAGPLGSYGCDVPIDTLTTMGEYINENLKPDIVFWTGDIVPHDQWEYDVEYVTNYQKRLADFMVANMSSYVIYPLEGNHDFEVANSQDFRQPDTMLEINLNLWKQWLDEEAQNVYMKAGYYTQKLKLQNGKVFDKRDDPGGVLQWLNETFHAIEARGEIAIIISHIPPADDSCLYQWSIRYKAITDRFQHIIRFSVYGHVHEERHNIAKSFSTGKPIGVQYWASSVSTWYQVNPSFRMIEVDVETMLPVKMSTYSLNLTEDNPTWNFDHEMTEHYDMKDLSPSSFVDLSNRFLANETTALRYQLTKSLWGLQTYQPDCDADCRKSIYCQTMNSVHFEYKDCMGQQRYELRGDPLNTFLEYMGDPWLQPINH
eukprot:403336826